MKFAKDSNFQILLTSRVVVFKTWFYLLEYYMTWHLGDQDRDVVIN